jgi:hypothetical protein
MPAGVSAWTPLANITLSAAQTTVTFSSISGAYKDLRLVYRGNVSSYRGNSPSMRFNNDSSNAAPTILTTGDGTSVYASTSAFSWINISDANYIAPNGPMLITLDIFDYSATDKHKTVLSRANAGAGVNANCGRWPSTAAITTITLSSAFSADTFVIGSTFALYGVSA